MTRPEQWLRSATCLRVPDDLAGVAIRPPFAASCRAEPPFDEVFVETWGEAQGPLEERLAELHAAMAPGGTLVLSLLHTMAPRQVRTSLQGTLSVFDHRPLLRDREQTFSVERAVRALSTQDFAVRDLVEVQLWDRQQPLASVRALLKVGIAATRHLVRVPGDRLWILAERRRPAPGSVLIARTAEDPPALARTRAALTACLPAGWECIEGEVHERECASWNEALTRSTGDFVWLLRAGDEPDAATFAQLRHEAPIAPALPVGPDGEAEHGLGGVLLDRVHLLDIGPLPDELESDMLAGEEYQLRAAAFGHAYRPVRTGPLWRAERPRPGPRIEELSREFFARWDGVDELENPGDPAAISVAPAPWTREGREPRISLCMIAKNEERFLAGCLECVHEYVDEIVLVDTGSTDRTVAIAESFGAQVLHQAWEGDFSKPRNLGLAHATGDWILVLDADECVTAATAPAIRELARNERAAGYHVLFRNDHEGGTTGGVTMVRMFRNLPGIEYRYVIHEQVVMSLMEQANELGLAIHPSPLEVLHYGYSDEMMDERDKRRRNVELFEKQLAADPDDVYCLYKYADFLRIIGERGDDVRAGFARALELLRERVPSSYRMAPFAGEIAALLALQYARAGELSAADALVREGLRRFLPTPNLHYIAAGVSSSLGRNAEALEQYRCCLMFRDRHLAVPIQPGITGHVSYAGMASCYMQLGDLVRAADWLDAALREEPGYEVAVLLRSVLDMHEGAMDVAIARLAERIQQFGDSVAVRGHGAQVLGRLGMWNEACRWLEAAHALVAEGRGAGDLQAIAREAGLAALLAGDAARAESWLARCETPSAAAVLWLLDRSEGRPPRCAASAQERSRLAESLRTSGRDDLCRLLAHGNEENTEPLYAEVRR